MEEEKDSALLEFITDDDSYEYLERLFTCIEEDLIECYTMSIEELYYLNKEEVRDMSIGLLLEMRELKSNGYTMDEILKLT